MDIKQFSVSIKACNFLVSLIDGEIQFAHILETSYRLFLFLGFEFKII